MGDSGRGQGKGALQPLRTALASLSNLSPITYFLTPLLSFPQLEIPPSLLLESKTQRRDSLAWGHTVSPLQGPISQRPGILFLPYHPNGASALASGES